MNKESTQPLVTIIMPTYNRADFLTSTIKLILKQTYANFELIIINDCSTDGTAGILSGFVAGDSRIKILTNETNLKIVRSLNKGVREAKGIYIARADDDDPWRETNKLEAQILFLESHPDHALIGTGAILVDERGKEIYRYLAPESDGRIRSQMLFGNPFIHPSVVFRKSVLEKSGMYDENLKDAEDWDLWMRIGMHGKLHNLSSYGISRFYGTRGLSIKNRSNISKTRLTLIKKYRRSYPHFIGAYLFNGLQRLYSIIPYTWALDTLLFKMKRAVLSR